MVSVTTSLVSFTAAAAVLTITPGLDTALVLRTAATEGARRAALAAGGIVVGCFAQLRWVSARCLQHQQWLITHCAGSARPI